MIQLQSTELKASISPLGAELQSVIHQPTGIEHMWQANPQFWGKHSPVLFPIVGSLLQNQYIYKGETYTLPRHGFAREKKFATEQISDTKAIFTLENDANTLKVYPFAFTLQLIYEIIEKKLSCTYAVTNKGDETMLFSIGAHPAFKVPLVSGTQYQDHYLQFEQDEPLLKWPLQDGLIGNEMTEVKANNGRLPLDPSLFYEDAMVFKHLKSTKITLANTQNRHGLHFTFTGFPYMGIWAAKDAPFVCIEPWCGHADTVGHNQQLTEKPGIENVEGGGNWERTWSLEIF